MTFRSNQYRRHYSEEEGEIGEEEGEIASPVRTPSANLTSTIAPLPAPVNNNNNNSNANHAAVNPSGINTINLSALQPTNRLPAPINRGPRSLPDRGFRRAPAFSTSAGRGSGWPLRRSWSEQSPGPPSGGIQRTPSFSGRSNAPTSDVFRSSDPRNNHSRPTDPRNLGHTEVTSLSNSGGPLRPTDPRQLTTPINDTASGESPNRTEQGPPHVHRSPSLNKPVRNLSFVAGRGNGPHVPTSSFNNVPPFRPGIFSSRPGRGNGNRRDSFTVQPQQRDTSFNRAGTDEPFRRPAEALDPFGRAPRTESSSTETFGRIPQPERSSEAVDMFGRTPIARIERQNSDSSFRSRSAGDEPGLIRPRSDDSFYNRPLLLERNQSEPVDSGFGGLGSGRVGQSTGPRRFSSYSSLANDHSVPPRIEHPPHRTVDQVTFNRPRQSPSNRDTGSGSPQKTLLVTQPSDPSLEVIPKPLFSEGDPRKKAAEIRGYSAPQASMLDRQDSRGFIAPPALMKPDSRSYEQNVLEHHDSRGHQQPPMEKQGNKIPSVPHTTFEVPDTGRPITVERLTIPPKSPFWNGPFPRRDPRAVENRPKPPENHTSTKPETQKLTCSSLGDPEVVRRAEDAVKELCELVGIPSLAEGNGSSQLPTKQLIMKAMTMLDIKIKDCQASVERADKALSNAIVEESKERQRLEKQKLEETAREKEEVASKRREEIQKQDQALIDLRSKLKNEIEIRRQSFEGEKKGIEESLVDRIKQAKSEFKKRKKLELKEQLEHAGLVFNTGINKAQRQVQKALKEAANAKTNATGAAAHHQLKLQESEATSRLPNLQHEAGINELIAKIVEENKQRAAQAQDESLSLLPVFQSDNESVDPKHGKTNEEWTNLARHVTGLTDALYAEPSESPYFDQISDAYELIGPVVKEYVRDMKRQLTERWHELAEEYVVRTSLYGKKVKKRGATKGNSASGAKPRCHRSSILGFDGSSAPSTTSSAIADSGNGGGAGRSTNNPYRRARRGHAGGAVGDVVRSEYEQEQIIAELTAKEAMEKRIAHGGSKLPRQICRLERELTASYFNTFTHQRVFDPMEESYKQSITNVWTDMEKCIFLDRFMQHPKDFRKIASFLRNKTTRDCISYYYASKQIVPYKQALKEHLMRRKRRGEYHNWDSTIQAALASGSKVMAGTSEDKPLVFHLPEDDNTYHTSKLHPMKREILDAIDISLCHYDEASLDGVQSKKRKRQKEPWFILDTEQRKFLRQVEKEPVVAAKHPSDDQPKIPRTSSGSSIISEKCGVVEKGMLGRKAHKWTAEDKRQFFETIEKHGKNWSLLSSAVESKTMAQIKNYYYDHKKLFGRHRLTSRDNHVVENVGNQNQDDQDSLEPHSSDIEDDHEASRQHNHQTARYENEHQLQQIPVADSHHEQILANAELWAQAQLLKQQQEHAAQLSAHEEARRYMQSHSHSQQQQHVLSNLSSMFPWMTASQVAQAQVTAIQQQQQQQQQHQHQHHVHRHHHNVSQSTVREWDNEYLVRANNRTPPIQSTDSSRFTPAAAALQSILALRQAHAGNQGFSMDAASQLRSMAALAGLSGINTGNGLNALNAPSSSSLSAVDVDHLERARTLLGYRGGVQAESLAGLGVGSPHSTSSSSAVDALGLLSQAVRRAEGNGFHNDGRQGNPYSDMNNPRPY